MTPAFIAKLTDTNAEVEEAMKYRAFELYDFWPSQITAIKPFGYDRLIWADTLDPVVDLEQTLRTRMKRLRRNRTVSCVKEIGWLFSNGPESKL